MLAPPWPTQVDYQDALQSPAVCFADPELQAAVPADLTPFGLPAPITGQFANVYRLHAPEDGETGRASAVRLFLGPSPDRARRYAAITRHLAALASPLPALVPVDYQERGILVRGEWYPLVKMEWVAGTTLNAHIDAHLYRAEHLRSLAEAFRSLARDLADARIAHGDLQHGNLLVEPGADGTPRLRLVDYDGMWVPEMAGWSGSETGHPSYQHPHRTARDFGPFLDRFASLVIYAALRAVAVAPTVWFRLDNGDNLLFRKEDFRDPADSEAFRLLRETLIRCPKERRLADSVRQACAGPLSRIPDLEMVIADGGE